MKGQGLFRVPSLHQALSGTRVAIKKQTSVLKNQAAGASRVVAAADVEQLRGARDAVRQIIESKYCSPILVRTR